jgi:hypothetical protein
MVPILDRDPTICINIPGVAPARLSSLPARRRASSATLRAPGAGGSWRRRRRRRRCVRRGRHRVKSPRMRLMRRRGRPCRRRWRRKRARQLRRRGPALTLDAVRRESPCGARERFGSRSSNCSGNCASPLVYARSDDSHPFLGSCVCYLNKPLFPVPSSIIGNCQSSILLAF